MMTIRNSKGVSESRRACTSQEHPGGNPQCQLARLFLMLRPQFGIRMGDAPQARKTTRGRVALHARITDLDGGPIRADGAVAAVAKPSGNLY